MTHFRNIGSELLPYLCGVIQNMNKMSKVENLVRLNDGYMMPMIGFGTYQMPKPITEQEEASSDGGNSRKKCTFAAAIKSKI